MFITGYPAYENYKHSGYSWMGDIPSHWTVDKLGTSLRAISEKNRPDLPLLSITREKGVIKRDLDDEESNHNFIPDDLSGYKVLRAGQFGMNKMKAWQGSYGVSQHTGIVSPAYFIFDFIKEIDRDYFNRAIRSKVYVSFFGSASDGVRIGQWDLNKARMREIPLLLPPLSEQRAISRFLDEKCAGIDEAVRIKEQEIELLRERRKILIQEAVTLGLNPDAPMKDSGVDWIGLIPAHWSIERAKWLYRKMGRPVRPGDDIVTCFRDGQVTLRTNRRTDGFTNALKEHGYQGIRKGDLVIHAMDAFAGAIGVSDSDGKSTPVYSVCVPRSSETVDPYFHAYFLRNAAFSGLLASLAKGIRERSTDFRFNDFSDLELALPPLIEQRAIVKAIEESSQKMEKAIAVKQEQITALREYQTSLINSAVTGKIKVI